MIYGNTQNPKGGSTEFSNEREATIKDNEKIQNSAPANFKTANPSPTVGQRNLSDVYARLKKSTRKKSAGIF